MRFEFNDDQRELREIVRAFLDRHAGPDAVRAAAFDGDGFARDAWARLTGEMELTGLAIDPERGGAGASFVEVGIALEELGRTLLPVPYLPTVVAAGALAGAPEGGELLERIAGGAVAALALDQGAAAGGDAEQGAAFEAAGAAGELSIEGSAAHVLEAPHADLYICAARVDGELTPLAVPRGAGVEVVPQMTLDQTRRQGELRLDGAAALRLAAPGEGEAALQRARDLFSVALAVEAVGAAARIFEVTLDYLRERVQFGRPIGSFQALKHRCADLAAALEAARSTAYYATWAADAAPEELPVLAPLARAVCNDAFLDVAAEAIQMHGGIGFTWEHDAHLYFKRAKTTDLLGGGSRAQRRLAAERAAILG